MFFKRRIAPWQFAGGAAFVAMGALLLSSGPQVWAASAPDGPAIVWAQWNVSGARVWVGAVDDPSGRSPATSSSNSARQTWIADDFHQAILVSLGNRADVRVILTLSKGRHATAAFYSPPSAKVRAIGYHIVGVDTLVPAKRDLVATLTTKTGNSWYVGGHLNYNLSLRGYANGVLDSVGRVRAIRGIPESQVQTTFVPGKKRSEFHPYGVFGLSLRMRSAPPFVENATFLRYFPFFAIANDYLDSIWFAKTPAPFVYNPVNNSLLQMGFVGFENSGIYRINSYSYPPTVAFESPFAFYNFLPDSRAPQLVVRDESFPKGDPYANVPDTFQQSAIRYSWTEPGSNDWKFSLQMAGSAIQPTSYLAGVTLKAVPPGVFPGWVVSKKWPFVNFVEATDGYSGSEGVYFYGGYMDEPVWLWLGGLTSQAPTYLVDPVLPKTEVLTDSSGEALPAGFRAQYSSDYLTKPQLYIGRIGRQVDLLGATGGIWNLGSDRVLRSNIIGAADTVNHWTLTRTRSRRVRVLQSLEWLDGYLIYSGQSGIQIAYNDKSPIVRMLPIPKNKASWSKFSRLTDALPNPNANALQSWIPRGSETLINSPYAKVMSVYPSSSGFTVVVKSTKNLKTARLGILRKGTSVLTYQTATRTWTNQVGTSARIQTHVGKISASLGHQVLIDLAIKNRGNTPWTGSVSLLDGHSVVSRISIRVLGNGRATVQVPWTPEVPGKSRVMIRAGNRILTSRIIDVRSESRIAVLSNARAIVFGWGGRLAAALLAALLATLIWLWRGGKPVDTNENPEQ